MTRQNILWMSQTKKLSEAKLDYRLNFFGSGQLGNDKDTQQKLKLGTIDIALLSSTLATNIPQMAILNYLS